METATLAALRSVDGPGWRVVRVGGGQRGLPSHDADFVVTHDTDPERYVGTRLGQLPRGTSDRCGRYFPRRDGIPVQNWFAQVSVGCSGHMLD